MKDEQDFNHNEQKPEQVRMDTSFEQVPQDDNREQPFVEKSIPQEPEYFFAGFWMRFWAYLLDLLIIGSVERLILKPIFRALDISSSDPSMFAPFAIATAVTFYLYFVLLTKFFKQTIGKMVFGLKVISLKDPELTWGTVLFREGIGRFISVFTKILYILVAFTPKKQGLHDIFADTAVIHERTVKHLQPAQ